MIWYYVIGMFIFGIALERDEQSTKAFKEHPFGAIIAAATMILIWPVIFGEMAWEEHKKRKGGDSMT